MWDNCSNPSSVQSSFPHKNRTFARDKRATGCATLSWSRLSAANNPNTIKSLTGTTVSQRPEGKNRKQGRVLSAAASPVATQLSLSASSRGQTGTQAAKRNKVLLKHRIRKTHTHYPSINQVHLVLYL